MVLLSSSSLLVRVHSIKAVAYNNRTINLQRNILNRNQTFFLSTKAPATSNLSDPESRLTLYQYQICPFCNKTKALLNYASIDYDEVEVNPLTKAELKPWSGSYRKVPIAILDGEQHNGSDEIQSALLNDNEISS